jgi:hypothetical protein
MKVIYEGLFVAKLGRLQACTQLFLPYIQDRTAAALERRHVFHYWYARCLLNLDRPDLALGQFRKAESRFPGYKDAAARVEALEEANPRRRSRKAKENEDEEEQESSRSDSSEESENEAELKDPFKILGISPSASNEEIGLAYKKLIVQYHPDKVAALGPEFTVIAESRTKELNWAYSECTRAKAA